MLVGIFHQYCVEDIVSSVGYIINFLFNIWDFMFVIHCHHQIRSINLSHCCHIFPRLCAWGGCTIISCRIHIYPSIPGKLFSHYYCTVVWCTQLIGYIILLFAHYSTSLSSLCRRIWKYWNYKNACQVHSVECVSKIQHSYNIVGSSKEWRGGGVTLCIKSGAKGLSFLIMCFNKTKSSHVTSGHPPLDPPLCNICGCVYSAYQLSCDNCEKSCTRSYYQIGSMNHLPLFRVR